jgi:hypothetical protein
MTAPIQNPAKWEVRSVIRFLNAKGKRPAEIHKQIVAVYGKVMNRQNVIKWFREFSEGRTDVRDNTATCPLSVTKYFEAVSFIRNFKTRHRAPCFPTLLAFRSSSSSAARCLFHRYLDVLPNRKIL